MRYRGENLRAATASLPYKTTMSLIPNILTIARCVAVLAIAVLFASPWGVPRTAVLLIFIVAAATDYVDGYVARALNATSPFGRMLDSIADKLLIGTTLLMLCADGTIGGLNALAAALILMREIAISGLREHLGGRGVVMSPTLFAKWKTTVQMVAIVALLGAPLTAVPNVFEVVALILLWAAMVMTLVSGWQYVSATRGVWTEEKA